MMPRTLPDPKIIFARRRQQAADLRAGIKSEAGKDQPAGVGELPKRKPLLLAADKPAVRRKLPELHLCAGGVVQFF